MPTKEQLMYLVSAGGLLSVLWGGFIVWDERYAHSKDMHLLSMSLEQKIQRDDARELRKYEREQQSRYGDKYEQAPPDIKNKMKEVEQERINIEHDLEEINKEIRANKYGEENKQKK